MAYTVDEDGSTKRVWSENPEIGQSLRTPALVADLARHWNPVPDIQRPPPIAKKSASGIGPRGDGLRNQIVNNTAIRGFEQNIVYEAGPGGVWDNLYTERAVRDNAEQETEGQGLYIGSGVHTFNGLFTGDNGWQPNVQNLGYRSKGEHRHNVYVNEKSPDGQTFNDVLTFRAASIGLQSRRQSVTNRLFSYANSIGYLNAYGSNASPNEINDAVFFRGGYHWQGQGWTGDIAMSLYGTTIGRDITIVDIGPPPQPVVIPGATIYNGGAISCSERHPKCPGTPGGTLVAKGDCVIYNWTPESFTKANGVVESSKDDWSGDKPFDGAGFRRARGFRDALGVVASVEELISAVRDEKMTIAEGVKRCQRAVRDALTY